MKRLYGRFALVFAILLAITAAGSLTFFISRAMAQEDSISELAARLSQLGVPVNSIERTSIFPFRVEVVLQSNSDGEDTEPQDILSLYSVQREATLEPRYGNERIEYLKITLVNSLGNPIYWADEPVRVVEDLPPPPSDIADEVAADIIREAISLHEMALSRLDVSSDTYSGQTLEVELTVPDVEAANKAIPPFMQDLRKLPRVVNDSRGTQIKIVKVDIFDARGEPLLKYVRDIELSKQRWWQPEELTDDWFPHPFFIKDEG